MTQFGSWPSQTILLYTSPHCPRRSYNHCCPAEVRPCCVQPPSEPFSSSFPVCFRVGVSSLQIFTALVTHQDQGFRGPRIIQFERYGHTPRPNLRSYFSKPAPGPICADETRADLTLPRGMNNAISQHGAGLARTVTICYWREFEVFSVEAFRRVNVDSEIKPRLLSFI